MLFPTRNTAEGCRSYILERSTLDGLPINARLIQFLITPEDNAPAELEGASAELHIVLYQPSASHLAKQYWQHTGLGVSSRFAEYCLSMLHNPQERVPSPPLRKPLNKHYATKGFSKGKQAENESLNDTYLEERYGRNLPLAHAESAKRALRRRIAGVLVRDAPVHANNGDEPTAGAENLVLGPSARGVPEASETDVFLYPTGMSAIYAAHMLASAVRPAAKSICFGYENIS